jgi:2-amino-4-hydroxy-6-hydroxymethyldihydropteridine diphosphokinase
MAGSRRTSDPAMQYVIALGSNQRHHRWGRPEQVLKAAFAALAANGITVLLASPVATSRPLGPSLRRYANAAAIIRSAHEPPELLDLLKAIETAFGRRRGGQRWAARVLDLDLVLWDRGSWCAPGLIIPHPAFRGRAFVTGPVRQVAPGWRDPVTGLTMRQVHARLTRPRPLPR